jgi:hypothetical protein
MKNKFNKTDTIYERPYWIFPKPLKGFSDKKVSPDEREFDSRKIIWKNPIIIKETAWIYIFLLTYFKQMKGGVTENEI